MAQYASKSVRFAPLLVSGCKESVRRSMNEEVCSTDMPGAIIRRAAGLILCASLLAACTSPAPEADCSDEWQQQVESILGTGDGAGHGPDIGSEEWRSVVEFRLGVRGDPDVPARHSSAWCEYVQQKIDEGTYRRGENG